MKKRYRSIIQGPREDARISGEVRRLDDLRAVEIQRMDELCHVERKADRRTVKSLGRTIKAMMLAESRRIDANRASDVAAVALASTKTEMTAANLSEKATDTAAALAEKVDAVATVAAAGVAATALAFNERIKPLETARDQGLGVHEQRVEQRASFQWTFQQTLTIMGIAAGLIYFLLQTSP